MLAGCSSPATSTPAATPPATASASGAAASPAALLAAHGLTGLDGRAMIDKLDRVPVKDRAADLTASIRADELQLADTSGTTTSVPLPADTFYVSFAPYVSTTHDCFYHSLTTCLGELRNVDVQVTVTDKTGGSTLVDTTVRTYDNGFFGLWLPRDLDGTITIGYAGKSVTAPVKTGEKDPTCVTTAKLV